MNDNNKTHGFTLVELLVVISIIGILASIALVSFQGVQKRARDTQRRSDLKQYQTALEAYASRNGGLYPAYVNYKKLVDVCGDPDVILSATCSEDPKYDASDASSPYYEYVSTVQSGDGDPLSDGYVIWALNEVGTDAGSGVYLYWVYCSSGQSGEISQKPALFPNPPNPTCPF